MGLDVLIDHERSSSVTSPVDEWIESGLSTCIGVATRSSVRWMRTSGPSRAPSQPTVPERRLRDRAKRWNYGIQPSRVGRDRLLPGSFRR